MQRYLFLLSLFALVAVGCSDDEPNTVTAGSNSELEEAMDDSAMEEYSGAISDDSAPIEVGPTTTAPWETTLEDYPLLTLLDDDGLAWIGTASFIMTDRDGTPTFSGGDNNPEFLVKIDGWFGANNYIEFTINTANVNLDTAEGRPEYRLCGGHVAWLSQVGEDQYRRFPGQLPEIRGSSLDWTSEGCAESGIPGQFASLFNEAVAVEVLSDGSGFSISPANGDGDPHYFTKLDPAEIDTTTLIAPETTEPPQTTTTTTEASN